MHLVASTSRRKQPGQCSLNKQGVACLQGLGAGGLVLLLVTGELVPSNVVGFCLSLSNAFGLIAGLMHQPLQPVSNRKGVKVTANPVLCLQESL